MKNFRKIGMILSRRGNSYLPMSRSFGSDEEIFEKAERLGADAVRILKGPKQREFYVRSADGWKENPSLDPARPKTKV